MHEVRNSRWFAIGIGGCGLQVICGKFIRRAPDDRPAAEEAHLPDGFERLVGFSGMMARHAGVGDADELI